MQNQSKNTQSSLDMKIAARLGRVQLLIAALSTVAHECESEDGWEILDSPGMDSVLELVHAYGSRWFDECACLLKEQYNRKIP